MNVIFKSMLLGKCLIFILFCLPLSTLTQTDSVLYNSYSNTILIDPIEKAYKPSKHVFYWLFNKPLIKIQDSAVFITIDPVFNLTQFKSLNTSDSIASYRNTRGFAIRGQIGSKLTFESLFTENQGFFPNYQHNFIQYYGIYPGQGRVKTFKTNGYDFAQAQGKITLKILKHWQCTFGNGKNIVGQGYRSLILSDATFSYPYLANQIRLGKYIKYTILQAWLQNLNRIPVYTTSEAGFKRKYLVAHYTQFFPLKGLDIGIYNSTLLNGYDSLKGNSIPNILFFQPLPFLNQVIARKTKPYFLSAVQASYNWSFVHVYGQYTLDLKGHSGYQLGTMLKLKTKNILVSACIEQNKASTGLYQTPLGSNTYTHYNQSLAHPQGNGFYENLISLDILCFHRFGFYMKYIHTKLTSDSLLYPAYNLISNETSNINHLNASIGYLEASAYAVLNTWYNMTLYASWTNRIGPANSNDRFLSFGIKSNLYREYFDF